VKSIRDRVMGALNGFRAGGYDGARETTMRPSAVYRGVSPVDEDNQIGSWDRNRLRLECIDLRRNNAIVAGVCERFADNVVGPGIIPQAKTTDPGWNVAAEEFWMQWSKVADYRKRVSLRELQRLVVQQRLLSGESFLLLTDGGQLQPIEAERICTPNEFKSDPQVVDGVRMTREGIISGYYVAGRGQGGRVDTTAARYIRREDIIHPTRPIRFDQVRGVPELSPVINALRDFGMLTESTLQRAKMDARRGWAVYSEDGAAKIANLGPRDATSNATRNQTGQVYEKVEDGTTYYLRPGDQIQSLASNTPNSQYVPYNELLLRLIGAALSIPYEFLVLDFKQGSFSASKAALAQTYKTFLNWHVWTVEGMMTRLWNWRIAKAIKDGQLSPAPTDARGVSQWYRVEWSQPDYTWLDPEGGIDTHTKAFNAGVSSVSAFARKQGRDGEDILREKATDIATAQRVAEETNKASGTNLTWRDLIMTMQPGQVSQSPAPAQAKNEKESPDEV
jgi:lambda family phage portal protein